MTAPETFLGIPVPADVRGAWETWEAAEWRSRQHREKGETYPPDERFNVRPPAGLCPLHHEHWLGYRDMHFNPVTGDRWPGHPGSPFLYVGHNMRELREQRRAEWDRKASAQMRQIERICLSGRSPQCTRAEVTA